MDEQLHRIDVHHHIIPPEYVTALADIGVSGAIGAEFPKWKPETSLKVMDANGIECAITSISSPGVFFGDQQFANDLARRCNEYSADLVSTYPDRFGAFAVLPLPDVEAAIDEFRYALDELRLDGVVLLTNVGDHYLGDPAFDVLYEELNSRRTVVLVHPTDPMGEHTPNLGLPNNLIEATFDTTRAALNLVRNRIPDRYPEIRFIMSHAGGTAPYLAWRIGLVDYIESNLVGKIYKATRDFYVTGNGPHFAVDALKKLYYDTANAAAPYPLRALQELVEPTQIVFGSDFPFAPKFLTTDMVRSLAEYDGFDEQELLTVERRNALRLFDRIASRLGETVEDDSRVSISP